MLERVKVERKRLEDYLPLVGPGVLEEIRDLAAPLRGARVVHVNATAFGGGVAEILQTLVPLMIDVGLQAEWRVIEGDEAFFQVTKASHNGLQGMELPLTEEMRATWRRYNEANARRFEGEYDYVVVHDPQPAGLPAYTRGAGGRRWIWRCHIDTSRPNPEYWAFYAPYLAAYQAGVFTLPEYVGEGVRFSELAIIPPSIDPLAPKNVPPAPEQARDLVARFGVDPDRPLVTQVSRFDPWKDPLGVIDAYRLAARQVPGLQLALVGSMASDDPEGWVYLDRTLRHAGEDPDLFVLHNFHGVGAVEVGAFQAASQVVVQKSTREGFGLVVSEALWKGRPVVGGAVGGIPLQVLEGQTGHLVHSVEECTARVVELLTHPEQARQMGESGREHVRRNFLSTRHLRDYLKLFQALR
jgi:trehalose synthase